MTVEVVSGAQEASKLDITFTEQSYCSGDSIVSSIDYERTLMDVLEKCERHDQEVNKDSFYSNLTGKL